MRVNMFVIVTTILLDDWKIIGKFFRRERGWDYMSFRLWIGLWTALILFILVAIDASALVCYITRFTEENFACLIAFIFIMKVRPIISTYKLAYVNKVRNNSFYLYGLYLFVKNYENWNLLYYVLKGNRKCTPDREEISYKYLRSIWFKFMRVSSWWIQCYYFVPW